MAKGVKYTQEQREMIFAILREPLLLGYSLNKAWELVFGNKAVLDELAKKFDKKDFFIDYSTVTRWIQKDPLLATRIAAWRTQPSENARKNWVKKIEEGDYTASKEWLERIEKQDFSLRKEITGQDGEPIKIDEQKKGKIDKLINRITAQK